MSLVRQTMNLKWISRLNYITKPCNITRQSRCQFSIMSQHYHLKRNNAAHIMNISRNIFNSKNPPQNAAPMIVQDARDSSRMDSPKYIIVDVREKSEIDQMQLNRQDWINITKDDILNTKNEAELRDLFVNKGRDLNDYSVLYFLCRSGVRSMTSAQHISKFKDFNKSLINIDGGILEYASSVPKGIKN